MLSLTGRAARLCDGWSRREVLRAGGLSLLGLSLPDLLAAETASVGPTGDKTFGRAKNVIFLWLQGGPPQHETFDPKPDAPLEIRGPFRPIQTNVPDIQFCELLPRTARRAHQLAVVRSLSTDDNIHSSSGYWVLTGYKYRGPNPRTIQSSDWPYFGSIVKMLKPSDVLPPLSTVWIPDVMRLNESVTPAGQTAGFLGAQWHPERIVGDPARADYEVDGLNLGELPPMRLRQRKSLLSQVEAHFRTVSRGEPIAVYDRFQQQAFDLLMSGKAREAFAIEKEPEALRERYGRTTWGQCVLLSRRLIEAGVRMVHVNWPREPGDNAVDNPLWDTHAQNADRVEDVLCPQFDVGFTALLDDLDERGLFDETLVVAVGEFGRTPKINAKGGRDHWGPVFSMALAGAGISGGQVYGASDRHGAYPARDRVQPGDLTATIFHLLGIDPRGEFFDREGRPHRLTPGQPLFKLLGIEPATAHRVEPGGEIARVPPYDDSLLLNVDFAEDIPLRPAGGPSRPKGWRGDPLPANSSTGGLSVRITGKATSVSNAADCSRTALISIETAPSGETVPIGPGTQAILTQEVRSPFAGSYVLTARVRGGGSTAEFFENVLRKQFTCRLIFYQYKNQAKSVLERLELAAIMFDPHFGETFETVELRKRFANPNPGQNFSFGNGLGVAIVLEKSPTSVLTICASPTPQQAYIEVEAVRLAFEGKPRLDDVTV